MGGGGSSYLVEVPFDVANAGLVVSAARELEQAGYQLLHAPREEPWGQTVARLQSPEGAIIGISNPIWNLRSAPPGGVPAARVP